MESERGPTSHLSRYAGALRRVLALLEDDGVHGVSFQFKLELRG